LYSAYLLADTFRVEWGDLRSMKSCALGDGDIKDTSGMSDMSSVGDAFCFFEAGVELAIDLCDDDSPLSLRSSRTGLISYTGRTYVSSIKSGS
jgi:hypothetical protein